MDDIVTVNYLKSILDSLSENGAGEMKISCADGYIHQDEVSVNHADNKMTIKGFLYDNAFLNKVRFLAKESEELRRVLEMAFLQ